MGADPSRGTMMFHRCKGEELSQPTVKADSIVRSMCLFPACVESVCFGSHLMRDFTNRVTPHEIPFRGGRTRRRPKCGLTSSRTRCQLVVLAMEFHEVDVGPPGTSGSRTWLLLLVCADPRCLLECGPSCIFNASGGESAKEAGVYLLTSRWTWRARTLSRRTAASSSWCCPATSPV